MILSEMIKNSSQTEKKMYYYYEHFSFTRDCIRLQKEVEMKKLRSKNEIRRACT